MNELAALIDTLSEKLGVAAGELYSVMQTQARLYIIKGLVWCAVYIGVVVFTFIFLKKVFFDKTRTIESYEKEISVSLIEYHDIEDNEGRYVFYWAITVFLGIISIICFFLTISTFNDVITCIFNPKYWAMNQILSYLK